MLTKSALLAATSRHFRDVVIPDDFPVASIAGQTIRCWSSTAATQSAMQMMLIDTKTGDPIVSRIPEIKARKFIATVGDEQGNMLFSESDLADILDMPASLVDHIAEVCDELNSFIPTVSDLKKT